MAVFGIEAAPSRDARLQIAVHYDPVANDTLKADVTVGLTQKPKRLPPKHFYDHAGSLLFDAICKTDEYYQTRTELELLRRTADEIVTLARPAELVELGSGAARKTRVLLDALRNQRLGECYVPVDVSQQMLLESGKSLLQSYPWISIRGLVIDYEKDLERIPRGERRLIAFLGSTIGNFEEDQARIFLTRLRALMRSDEALLLGLDLVKDEAILNAAYNDAQGLTAAFNKNVLRVINRRLKANFDLNKFDHVAFFNSKKSQIEMHLAARVAHSAYIQSLSLEVEFGQDETILTEISRKFTRQSATALLEASGFSLERWYSSPSDLFGLALAVPAPIKAGRKVNERAGFSDRVFEPHER